MPLKRTKSCGAPLPHLLANTFHNVDRLNDPCSSQDLSLKLRKKGGHHTQIGRCRKKFTEINKKIDIFDFLIEFFLHILSFIRSMEKTKFNK